MSKEAEPPSSEKEPDSSNTLSGNSAQTAPAVFSAQIADSAVQESASIYKKLKNKITRIFGRKASLEEEVVEMIEEHPEGKQVGSEERTLLHNVLGLNELKAEDVMIPRADIIAIDYVANINELRQTIIHKGHTRIPVYKENLDNVVGFIHIKDIIPYLGAKKKFNIDNVIREVLFVPPAMKITDLLIKMQASRVHIAIVLDEYGGTDGLVTLEDVMEEIVGEIEDEHDEEVKMDFTMIDDNTYEANARMTVEELEEKLGVSLKKPDNSEDFETIGGLIFYILGKVPRQGEVIRHEDSGVEFEITKADPRRIEKLLIRKK